MKIAVFVETYTPTMGADHRQVMMIPHNDTVRVFTRLSDGNKGYGNRWDESDIETVVNAMDASESITCIPSGVRLTAKDIEALDLKGYAPVLKRYRLMKRQTLQSVSVLFIKTYLFRVLASKI
jgi:hypothetical protein